MIHSLIFKNNRFLRIELTHVLEFSLVINCGRERTEFVFLSRRLMQFHSGPEFRWIIWYSTHYHLKAIIIVFLMLY